MAQLAKKDYLGKATVSRLIQLPLGFLWGGPCTAQGGMRAPPTPLPVPVRDCFLCGGLEERWADAAGSLSPSSSHPSLPA